jgi:hypothetical protein
MWVKQEFRGNRITSKLLQDVEEVKEPRKNNMRELSKYWKWGLIMDEFICKS